MLRPDDAADLLARAFGPSAAGERTRFVAIAGDSGLRWIVPERLGKASSALSNWQPHKTKSRIGWTAIQLLSRAGALSLLPGARTFEMGLSDVAWREYGWTQDHAPQVITYVGTPGPDQKLVCSLVDPRTSDTALIVKFPLWETAKERLRREFATLHELIAESRDIAPKPLRIHKDARFAAQSYLQGRPVNATITTEHLKFLASLVRRDKRIHLETVRSELRRRHGELVDQGVAPRALLRWIGKTLDSGDWSGAAPSVRASGDFAPWNLKRSADGRIRAVDWESSAVGELPYIDLHHYRFQVTEGIGSPCRVPWEAYTAALQENDPEFSGTVPGTTLAASKLTYWMRSRFMDRWREETA